MLAMLRRSRNGSRRPGSDYWKVVLIALIWVGVVVLLLGTGSRAQRRAERVPGLAPTTCAAGTLPDNRQPARLTLKGANNQVVPLGRHLERSTRELEYTVDDPDRVLRGLQNACLFADPSPFLDENGDSQLDDAKIYAEVRVTGTRVLLRVTFDRSQNELGPPGAYSGVVSVIDPRIERLDVPLRVTMAYPFWQFPLALLIGLIVPAGGYVWLLKGSFEGVRGQYLTVRRFQEYAFSRNGVLAFVSGSTAATGVFIAGYLKSDTWGGDVVQAVGLLGAMFTAFVAAATTVSAAGSDTSRKALEAVEEVDDGSQAPVAVAHAEGPAKA
jgi:hypothetical protein